MFCTACFWFEFIRRFPNFQANRATFIILCSDSKLTFLYDVLRLLLFACCRSTAFCKDVCTCLHSQSLSATYISGTRECCLRLLACRNRCWCCVVVNKISFENLRSLSWQCAPMLCQQVLPKSTSRFEAALNECYVNRLHASNACFPAAIVR